jgi:hypothetical protein
MTADQQDRLDRAVALAREVLHFPAPLWMCEEVMAMEFLSFHGPFVPDAKAEATPARAAPDGADPEGATSARAAVEPDPEVEEQVAAVRSARRVCRMKEPFDPEVLASGLPPAPHPLAVAGRGRRARQHPVRLPGPPPAGDPPGIHQGGGPPG